MLDIDPAPGIDAWFPTLDFGDRLRRCLQQVVPYQRVHIVGTEGRIEIEIPFNALTDKPCRLWVETEGIEGALSVSDQYAIRLFLQAVLTTQPSPRHWRIC